jgi:hypothetical protein
MADTAVVGAAIGGHERAFLIFANGCTKQGYHLLKGILIQKGRDNPSPGLMHSDIKLGIDRLFA